MENRGEEEETIRLREMRAAAEGRCGAAGCGAFFGRYWPTLFRSLAVNALEGKALSKKRRAALETDLDAFEGVFCRAAVGEITSSDCTRQFVLSALISNHCDVMVLERALGVVREQHKEPKRKGGRTQARKLHRAKWDQYGRQDVLQELKGAFRAEPSIKKATAVKHLRTQLNPNCDDRTLGRLFDKWKATEKRLFSKGH